MCAPDDARVVARGGAAGYIWKDVGATSEAAGRMVGLAGPVNQARAEAQRAIRGRATAPGCCCTRSTTASPIRSYWSPRSRMQANAVTDISARHALQEMQGRIMAVAGIHRRLYTSSDVTVVELGSYIMSLIDELSAALDAGEKRYAVMLQAGADVRVPTDKAVSIGVIVTELVTNAHKYAYPPGTRGEIRVVLRHSADGVVIAVEDDGVAGRASGRRRAPARHPGRDRHGCGPAEQRCLTSAEGHTGDLQATDQSGVSRRPAIDDANIGQAAEHCASQPVADEELVACTEAGETRPRAGAAPVPRARLRRRDARQFFSRVLAKERQAHSESSTSSASRPRRRRCRARCARCRWSRCPA